MAYRSATQPLCRYCGRKIAKSTTTIFCERTSTWQPKDDTPRTKADCERISNQPVVSVKYHHPVIGYDDSGEPIHGPRFVNYFSTWDGESYQDGYFCNGEHARNFAYAIAVNTSDLAMPAYWKAVERQQGVKP